jgi:hypothetical protein
VRERRPTGGAGRLDLLERFMGKARIGAAGRLDDELANDAVAHAEARAATSRLDA